jgi:hypothetical protein
MIMGGAGGFTKAEAQALLRLLSLPELARPPQSVTTELLH